MLMSKDFRNSELAEVVFCSRPWILGQRENRKSEFEIFLGRYGYNVLERFVSPVTNNRIPVIAFNLDLNVIFYNSSAKADFQVENGSMMNTSLDDIIEIIDGPVSEENISHWKQMIRAGVLTGFRIKRWVMLRTGLQFQLAFEGSPLLNNRGDLIGGAFYYTILSK